MISYKIDHYSCKEEHRTVLESFLSIAKQFSFLLRALFPSSQFELITVNISLYILFLNILFSVNSLFFTLDCLNNKSDFKRVYLLPLISTVFIMIVYKVFCSLITEPNAIECLSLEEPNLQRGKIIRKILKRYKLKIVMVITLEEIFNVFLWYYESIFCSLFSYDKNLWIKCVI